jgi:hypothetical protein
MDQPALIFDPSDIATIRSESVAIQSRIEDLLSSIEDNPEGFDVVETAYRTQLQPTIIGLVEAMLHYVPNEDPRIMIEFASGNFRRFKSDDATVAACPLCKETAEVHLHVISEKLEQLAAYLPR